MIDLHLPRVRASEGDLKRDFQINPREFLIGRGRPRLISVSAHRGRPDLYDPHVVWAFADSIAEATGRKFTVGHHGDKTITDERMAGPMRTSAAARWSRLTCAATCLIREPH